MATSLAVTYGSEKSSRGVRARHRLGGGCDSRPIPNFAKKRGGTFGAHGNCAGEPGPSRRSGPDERRFEIDGMAGGYGAPRVFLESGRCAESPADLSGGSEGADSGSKPGRARLGFGPVGQ